MKRSFIGLFFLSFTFILNAQLADGVTSPDFDLDDILGVNHQLYSDYLDNDKHVVLDFSATWCGPCWSYHNSGALEGFYEDHGPAGDDVAMVFMMEGDASTNTNCLYGSSGCNNSTWGNWVSGTDYPIIDAPTNQLRTAFSIGFWPTIYMINGYDNRIFEVGQLSANGLSNWLESFELEVTSSVIVPHDCLNYGSIDLTTSGGFGTLAYDWSNGSTSANITDLPTGDYFVTITDANGYFIEEGPFTVGADNSNPNFNITPSIIHDVTCNGENDGFIEVFATGLDLEYNWSNGSTNNFATNLAPGIHSVVVSNYIGCVDGAAFTINEPPVLLGNITHIDPTCLSTNGEISITGSGGIPPYDYYIEGVFSPTGVFSNLPPGDYNISVGDQNQCIHNTLVSLQPAPLPIAATNTPDTLDCAVIDVEIRGDGSSTGANYYYEWRDENNVAIATTFETMVSAAGIYTLIVTDINNCTSTTSVEVFDDYSVPDITSNDGLLTCGTSQVELCLDAPDAESFYWELNGQQIEDMCIMVQSAGDYTSTAVGFNGCEATSVSSVTIDTDLPEVTAHQAETLTCVLTSQIISAEVNGDPSDYDISWSTMDGNILNTVSALEIEIDAPGIYELSVTNIATGCNTLSSIIVDEFINTPEASFTANNDDDFLYLSGMAMGAPFEWEWYVNGEAVGNTQDFAYALMGESMIEVCLQIQNECGEDEYCNSVSITDPLTVTLNSTNVDCFGESTGSIEIMPQGGVGPYTFETVGPNSFLSMEENLMNLPAGNYQIIVNDNETRSIIVTVMIAQNPELQVSSQVNDPLCNGTSEGMIVLDVSGGAGAYEYEWSNGATSKDLSGLSSGDYSVHVTDEAGCIETAIFTLTEPEAIIQEGVIQDVKCHGEQSGSIALSLTGGTGMLTLDWVDSELDGITNVNIGAGTYTLNIQDENGCTSEKAYTVSEPDLLIYTVDDIQDDIDGNGGSIDVSISGGVTPYTFNWSNGETTEDLSNLSMGMYSLLVIDDNGCELFTEDFDIQFISDVNDIPELTDFSVYPNPTRNNVYVSLDFESNMSGSINLLNQNGKLLSKESFTQKRNINSVVNISDLANGIYLLKISTAYGTAVKKVSVIK